MHTAAAVLETARLRMTPFVVDDADELLRLFQDDHVRRYLLDGAIVDRAWVGDEIAASGQRFADGSLGLFAARLREGGALAGFAGFRPDHAPPVTELIYGLLPAFWGRGLAIEMARAMVGLAFDRMGWTVLHAAVDEPNQASVRLLERLGFRPAAESPGAFGRMIHFTLAAHEQGSSVESVGAWFGHER